MPRPRVDSRRFPTVLLLIPMLIAMTAIPACNRGEGQAAPSGNQQGGPKESVSGVRATAPAPASPSAAPVVQVSPPSNRVEGPPGAAAAEGINEGRAMEINGNRLVVGSRDRVTVTTTEEHSDTGVATNATRNANTTGVGLSTNAAEVAQNFKTENANVGLEGVGNAAGGGSTYSGQLMGRSFNFFQVLGAICLLAALGFVVGPLLMKTPPRLGTAAALAAGGVGFIAIGVSIDKLPYAWAFAGLLVLAGLAFWLFQALKNGKLHLQKDETTKAMVTAVKSLDDKAKMAFKDALNAVLLAVGPEKKAAVEQYITKMKSEMGL